MDPKYLPNHFLKNNLGQKKKNGGAKMQLYTLVCVRPLRKLHCWISHNVAHLYFQAYQKWKQEHKQGEPRLPGLSHFSHDQLFFLNFAQVSFGLHNTLMTLRLPGLSHFSHDQLFFLNFAQVS